MKKTACVAMALLIAFSLAACGNKDNGGNGDAKNPYNQPPVTTQGNTQTAPTTQPTGTKTGKDIKIPSEQVYFTSNADWNIKEDDSCTFIYESSACMVGICYSWSSKIGDDYEEMIAKLGRSFIKDAAIRCQGNIYNSEIEVLATEQTTVAGYESMKFTGKVNNDGNWDCHVYGYVYVVDEVKLMVVGIVSTPEQDAAMIAEIDALTDQIAASVRTEEE